MSKDDVAEYEDYIYLRTHGIIFTSKGYGLAEYEVSYSSRATNHPNITQFFRKQI